VHGFDQRYFCLVVGVLQRRVQLAIFDALDNRLGMVQELADVAHALQEGARGGRNIPIARISCPGRTRRIAHGQEVIHITAQVASRSAAVTLRPYVWARCALLEATSRTSAPLPRCSLRTLLRLGTDKDIHAGGSDARSGSRADLFRLGNRA